MSVFIFSGSSIIDTLKHFQIFCTLPLFALVTYHIHYVRIISINSQLDYCTPENVIWEDAENYRTVFCNTEKK